MITDFTICLIYSLSVFWAANVDKRLYQKLKNKISWRIDP